MTFFPALVSIAYFTVAERKILSAIQRRFGPAEVGVAGMGQPFADGVKLLLKEIVVPMRANFFFFFLAPVFSLWLCLFSWVFIPVSYTNSLSLTNLNILYFLAASSFQVYGIIIAGWASGSQYAFMGSIRAAAQVISYELIVSLSLLPIFFITGSLDFVDVVNLQEELNISFIIPFFPVAMIFLCAALAETNRAPFDLPEAEAELVAGYNVEYSSFFFALFFLAEYGHIILAGYVFSLLFLGGFSSNLVFCEFYLSIKVTIIVSFFVVVRAMFPRFRFDQLMFLC